MCFLVCKGLHDLAVKFHSSLILRFCGISITCNNRVNQRPLTLDNPTLIKLGYIQPISIPFTTHLNGRLLTVKTLYFLLALLGLLIGNHLFKMAAHFENS